MAYGVVDNIQASPLRTYGHRLIEATMGSPVENKHN